MNQPHQDRRRHQVDWKLLFNQLFALEIKKEHVLGLDLGDADQELDQLLQAYTQYTPLSFNEALDELSAVERSDDAYKARRALYEHPAHRRLIAEIDFSRSVSPELRRFPGVRRFLDALWHAKDRPVDARENFFESPEGRAAVAGPCQPNCLHEPTESYMSLHYAKLTEDFNNSYRPSGRRSAVRIWRVNA